MTSVDDFERLLNTSSDLGRSARAVQEGEGDAAAVDTLVAAYQDWYAEALAALPEDLHDQFRQEYEGGFFYPKIKGFLQAPREPNLLYNADEPSELVPYWQHPYETAFHAPLLAQQQLLREAAQRLRSAADRAGPARELALIEQICREFPNMLVPLGRRQRDRPAFEVNDEYDLQDLLHGVLKLFFEDVRPEEWTPSYAGGSSRMDFLLKRERIVIEAKMTRRGLRDRNVSDELILDKERYRAHEECEVLVAFVYDPGRFIENPRGLEDDLNQGGDGLTVRVLVVQA